MEPAERLKIADEALERVERELLDYLGAHRVPMRPMWLLRSVQAALEAIRAPGVVPEAQRELHSSRKE